MNLSEEQVHKIVEETINKLIASNAQTDDCKECWLCDSPEEAIRSAKKAQEKFMTFSLSDRGRFIEGMRQAARNNAQSLAELAARETGYGRIPDKVQKNLLAADKTPGVEDLQTSALSGDFGLTLVESAPFGVICSITPSTNPSSSIINNAISMVAAGNAVVFNPHPAAKKTSIETIRVLNDAIAAAGGPGTLICTVKEPSIETGKYMMEHKDVPLLSITGGEAVVKVAMKTGKKVIAAGPGNPPVIVDNTANVQQAAKDIVSGASFDNNILCIAEKEVFAFSDIFDSLMCSMESSGAYRIAGGDIDKIVKTVLVKREDGYVINRKFVGKDAAVIMQASGVEYTGDPRLIIAEVDEKHPFITVEMMMPIMGMVRVDTIEEAVREAVVAENGCKHSAIMHSQNITNLSMAAKALNTTLFVKNAPSYAGIGFNGEGHTTLTIATPTGEGITSARSFTRSRRCVMYGSFRIV